MKLNGTRIMILNIIILTNPKEKGIIANPPPESWNSAGKPTRASSAW
jgi:hypothetical protein